MARSEKRDKSGHLLGFLPHIYFSLSDLFINTYTFLEVSLFMNCYFLVCIFKYHTSTRILIKNVILILG